MSEGAIHTRTSALKHAQSEKRGAKHAKFALTPLHLPPSSSPTPSSDSGSGSPSGSSSPAFSTPDPRDKRSISTAAGAGAGAATSSMLSVSSKSKSIQCDCPHLLALRLTRARVKAILTPRNWSCRWCGTTESVWACLSCASFGCGSTCASHIHEHCKQQGHSLTLEINQRALHCADCQVFLAVSEQFPQLFDLCTSLDAVASNRSTLTRRGTPLRLSAKQPALEDLLQTGDEVNDDAKDKQFTAEKHYSFSLMARAFNAWAQLIDSKKASQPSLPPVARPPSSEAHSPYIAKLSSLASAPSSGPSGAADPMTPVHHLSASETHLWVPMPMMTPVATPLMSPSRVPKRRGVVAGTMGLRNLGNTCFMNVILQSLSNIPFFRNYVLAIFPKTTGLSQFSPSKLVASTNTNTAPEPDSNSLLGPGNLRRLDTMECYTQMSTRVSQRNMKTTSDLTGTSLLQALHALFRIMWSGKWAVITPHAMLRAIWQTMPAFQGFEQQDAQEFFCELISCLEKGLKEIDSAFAAQPNRFLQIRPASIISKVFNGRLYNEIICQKCKNVSRHYESLLDVSLDFPDRFQPRTLRKHSSRDFDLSAIKIAGGDASSASELHTPKLTSAATLLQMDASPPLDARKQGSNKSKLASKRAHDADSCTLEEMLEQLARPTLVDGQSYDCDKCREPSGDASSPKRNLQFATTRTLFEELPIVLAFHIKRFRWVNWQECNKISIPVEFPTLLDMSPYVRNPAARAESRESGTSEYVYELINVVEHHGKGIVAGHYTAYCHQTEEGSWVLFNDDKIRQATEEEALNAQAYMLFYARKSVLLKNPAKSSNSRPYASAPAAATSSPAPPPWHPSAAADDASATFAAPRVKRPR